jgi:hypothetical protein
MFQLETDDEMHPGVALCIDDLRVEIDPLDDCEAKMVVKSRYCQLVEPSVRHEVCMLDPAKAGSIVLHGGYPR